MLVGYRIGLRRGRGQQRADMMLEDAERARMLEMIEQLGMWTNQYSGDVTQFQNQLVEINEAFADGGVSQGENRFLLLLREIIQSNSRLQNRLTKAESQLEMQTRQLQSYLSEARTDALTGLANRRALDQMLDQRFEVYRGGGRSFVICLIDVDRFKNINDTYGHAIGDQVLQTLGKTLQKEVPGAEVIARFGGEEFAVLMKGPLHVAARQMNEVRRSIEKLTVSLPTEDLQITVSMGLAEPREDALVAPVLRRADESLYAAKNRGRNRVYFHDGGKPTLVGAPETVGA